MKQQKEVTKEVTIKPPNIESLGFGIVGTAPYVQLRFTQKAKNMLRAQMEKGTRNKGKAKPPRVFEDEFPQAMYKSVEGWYGIPAASFRNAMISACRLANFQMTRAKLSVFVDADGFDAEDHTPLVRIYGEPQPYESITRNATGVVDIRVRAMWQPGWRAVVRVTWDADQFTEQDVTNLLARVGLQVGLGEGRPDSKNSAGLGFGLFKLE